MESSSIRPREELEMVLFEVSQVIEFKDAHLELPSPENSSQLIEFLIEHGYKDETMSKALGLEFGDDMREIWHQRLKQPISLVLVLNSSGEVIGACTMNINELKVNPLGKRVSDEKLQKFRELLFYRHDELNVFKRYGVEKAIRIMLLCVHREHRKQGMATKLVEASLMFCKDVGLKPVCLHAVGTANTSQHVLEKAGFETLHSLKYADYRYDGEVVFHDTFGTESIKFYVKKLDLV